jgi:hypothetical protein
MAPPPFGSEISGSLPWPRFSACGPAALSDGREPGGVSPSLCAAFNAVSFGSGTKTSGPWRLLLFIYSNIYNALICGIPQVSEPRKSDVKVSLRNRIIIWVCKTAHFRYLTVVSFNSRKLLVFGF